MERRHVDLRCVIVNDNDETNEIKKIRDAVSSTGNRVVSFRVYKDPYDESSRLISRLINLTMGKFTLPEQRRFLSRLQGIAFDLESAVYKTVAPSYEAEPPIDDPHDNQATKPTLPS